MSLVEIVEIPYRLVAIQCRAGCNATTTIFKAHDVDDSTNCSFTFKENDFIDFINFNERFETTINTPSEHMEKCKITIAARPAFLLLLRMRGFKI